MFDKWIQSIIIKRVVLALAAAVVSHLVAFLASSHAQAALSYLSHAGLTVTVVVDQAKFNSFLTVSLFALSQGAHEWAANKYPDLAKYI